MDAQKSKEPTEEPNSHKRSNLPQSDEDPPMFDTSSLKSHPWSLIATTIQDQNLIEP